MEHCLPVRGKNVHRINRWFWQRVQKEGVIFYYSVLQKEIFSFFCWDYRNTVKSEQCCIPLQNSDVNVLPIKAPILNILL